MWIGGVGCSTSWLVLLLWVGDRVSMVLLLGLVIYCGKFGVIYCEIGIVYLWFVGAPRMFENSAKRALVYREYLLYLYRELWIVNLFMC